MILFSDEIVSRAIGKQTKHQQGRTKIVFN